MKNTMMNRFANKACATLVAASMVVSFVGMTTLAADTKMAASINTISISEELEEESLVAALEVTEYGVVNYGLYAC